MIPFPGNEIQIKDEQLFAEIVSAAFGQRRKTLRNTLRGHISENDLADLSIDSGLRAENLGYLEYAKICNLISSRQEPK
jgi:16S rRNA (adenine1518-N6/adenine1519-N6)-dimethyltransferase